MAESPRHAELKNVALRWLQRNGCVAFAKEMSYPFIGIVDASGVKNDGATYIVEVKISKRDLKRDITCNKIWKFQNMYSADYVYYLLDDNLDYESIPAFIGVLNSKGKCVRRAKKNVCTKDATAKFLMFAKACSWRAYGDVINEYGGLP